MANVSSIQGSPRRTVRLSSAAKVLLISTLLALPACTAKGPALIVHSARGDTTVNLEIANTPDARTRGLMYRTNLAEMSGMLFIFPDVSERSFWMKNTPLPLDMIFIAPNKRILGIVADTKPFTTNPLGVSGASKYVLEVNGGFCARRGIVAGDQVDFVDVSDTSQ